MSLNFASDCQYALLYAGSYLTEPACKVREHWYLPYMDEKEPSLRSRLYSICMVGTYSLSTPPTAPLGALCRKVASLFGPTLYFERDCKAKTFNEKEKSSVTSYNVCYMPGGYAVSDGGVTPPSHNNGERIDANNKLIQEIASDIVCLQEVPDIQDAARVFKGLSDYRCHILASGIKAMGPSSMMYVASKYQIDASSIQFTPFVKESFVRKIAAWFAQIGNRLIFQPTSFLQNPKTTWNELQEAVEKSLPQVELTGRAASSEKGFLSFNLADSNIVVICTHLQHSEIPEGFSMDPKRLNDAQKEKIQQDVASRKLQMLKIGRKIQELVRQGKRVILTGDFNQEEAELNQTLNSPEFKAFGLKMKRCKNVETKPTWGGDGWCASLDKDKVPSKPLVLDYTFVVGAESIETETVDVGFEGDKFKPYSLSDHKPVVSEISWIKDDSEKSHFFEVVETTRLKLTEQFQLLSKKSKVLS